MTEPITKERMAAFAKRQCKECEDRKYGGSDCEGDTFCYDIKVAILALISAPPTPTEEEIAELRKNDPMIEADERTADEERRREMPNRIPYPHEAADALAVIARRNLMQRLPWLRDKLQSWPGEMSLTSRDIADLLALISASPMSAKGDESSGEQARPAPLSKEVEEAMGTLHEAAYDGYCFKYHVAAGGWWAAVLKAEAVIKAALEKSAPPAVNTDTHRQFGPNTNAASQPDIKYRPDVKLPDRLGDAPPAAPPDEERREAFKRIEKALHKADHYRNVYLKVGETEQLAEFRKDFAALGVLRLLLAPPPPCRTTSPNRKA